jgi:HPt (histidine-containing phosphotransfer) domain-containing protein
MITRFPLLSFVLLSAAILSSAPSDPINVDQIAADAESSIERAGLRADGAARAAWLQALAIEPNFAWVKFALLPSLAKPPPMR